MRRSHRRHSGARVKRANPESITTAAEYGFRAHTLRACPGMTAVSHPRFTPIAESVSSPPSIVIALPLM